MHSMNEFTQTLAGSLEAEPVELVSTDGQLCFRMQRVSSGVAIERRHGEGAFGTFACWAIVGSVEQLVACSHIEDLRFEHPLIHAQLIRKFVDVLERPCPAASGC